MIQFRGNPIKKPSKELANHFLASAWAHLEELATEMLFKDPLKPTMTELECLYTVLAQMVPAIMEKIAFETRGGFRKSVGIGWAMCLESFKNLLEKEEVDHQRRNGPTNGGQKT